MLLTVPCAFETVMAFVNLKESEVTKKTAKVFVTKSDQIKKSDQSSSAHNGN